MSTFMWIVWQTALALFLGALGFIVYVIRPKDPIFEIKDIKVRGLNLRWHSQGLFPVPLIDVDVLMLINCTNPNLFPIHYSPSPMHIKYKGSLLGNADVPGGAQEGNTSRTLEVPAKMNGVEMSGHLKDVVGDVAKRQMTLDADVTINGVAKLVWRWAHRFSVTIESRVKVDPVLLEVIEQEHHTELSLDPHPSLVDTSNDQQEEASTH